MIFFVNEKGFSVIELLIVLGILMLISSFLSPIYGSFQVSTQLHEAVSQINQTLRIARDYSRAGFKDNSYGVYFEVNDFDIDKFILYQGSSYANRNQVFDREYMIGAGIAIDTTFTNDEINFEKNSGLPNNTGAVLFFKGLNHEVNVNVNEYGLSNIE